MEKVFKLLVVGDSAVGKTAYIQRCVQGDFKDSYWVTVGDYAVKKMKWSKFVVIKLQIWDIAGQERHTNMTRLYYKDADGCMIVFDVTRRNTFLNTLNWKKDLDSKCTLHDGGSVPCLLLANKCDLPDREVNRREIETFSKDHGFVTWMEASVKKSKYKKIEEPIRLLLKEMVKQGETAESGAPLDNDHDQPVALIKTEKTSKKCRC